MQSFGLIKRRQPQRAVVQRFYGFILSQAGMRFTAGRHGIRGGAFWQQALLKRYFHYFAFSGCCWRAQCAWERSGAGCRQDKSSLWKRKSARLRCGALKKQKCRWRFAVWAAYAGAFSALLFNSRAFTPASIYQRPSCSRMPLPHIMPTASLRHWLLHIMLPQE